MEDLNGVVLNKRYVIERFVGSGGMAEVYRAKDVDAPHHYAIKIIREQLLEHRNLVIRFEEEAERLKNLQHPNIVRFYDFVTSDGLAYIVMDYIDGYPLSRLLRLRSQRGEGPMPIEESVRILAQVSRALARVHEQGLVHRDVKPGNILIRQTDGAAFLTDLGIAKDLTRGAVTQTLVGTFAYLAPEQIMRQAVGPATDIYALGTVAYYMFTGQRPFEAAGDGLDTAEMEDYLIDQHLHKLPLPPSSHNPYLPPALDAAVGRALAKPMEARYRNVMEFMHSVHNALRSQLPGDMQVLNEIDARPVKMPSAASRPTYAPRRRSRRVTPLERRDIERRVLFRLLTVIAVIAVAALVIGALTRGGASPAAPGATATSPETAAAATSITPPPNLTITADWLTLEAERVALHATETALAQALVAAPAASETPTASAAATETAASTTTPTATGEPPSPTASLPPSSTPAASATATASATASSSATAPPDLRRTQRAVERTSTALAQTLSAPVIVTSTLPGPPPMISPAASAITNDQTTPTPTLSRTPNVPAIEARATLGDLNATATALALTITAMPTDAPTATPTATPQTPTATPTQSQADWCLQALQLRNAIGLDGVNDVVQEGINEEALQQYMVEREASPAGSQAQACVSYIDGWLYPRLVEAGRANFAEAYTLRELGRADDAGRHIDRARRYFDYAMFLKPGEADAHTLNRCANLLDLAENPIALREAIAALWDESGLDLSPCEPVITQMWEAANTSFPDADGRPLGAVDRAAELYDIPGSNPIDSLDAGVSVAVLGQTGEIGGDYWLLVELESGQRGYVERGAIALEDGLEAIPTVVPPPRPP